MSGTTKRVSLDQAELDAQVQVKDGFIFGNVRDHVTFNTFQLKSVMARRLLLIFIGTNVFTAALVGLLAWIDWQMINLDPKNIEFRLIDRTVVMSLIGATTIQVGIIAVSLFGSLFPKNGRDS